MNGVSHMLPFVVAGGIFELWHFSLIQLQDMAIREEEILARLPSAAAFFKTIGGVAFNLMVPILAGFIAMSIADRPGLLVGLVGGFLATSGATLHYPAAMFRQASSEGFWQASQAVI